MRAIPVVFALLLLSGCAFMDAPTGPKSAKVCPFIVATHDTVIVRGGQPWVVSDTTRRCY